MNKTITLPEGTYKCCKAKAVNKDSWMIAEGQTVTGEYSPIITVGERFHAEGRGFRDFISTSPVKDFKLLPDNKVEIQTENSVYLLEEVDPTKPLTLI